MQAASVEGAAPVTMRSASLPTNGAPMAEPFQMFETIRLYIGWSRKLMSSAYQQGGFRHGHSCDRDALSA
jgi:hypothetical protein